jgi:hypothetical protein
MTQLWLGGRTLRSAGRGSPSRQVRSRWGEPESTPSQSAVVPAHSIWGANRDDGFRRGYCLNPLPITKPNPWDPGLTG